MVLVRSVPMICVHVKCVNCVRKLVPDVRISEHGSNALIYDAISSLMHPACTLVVHSVWQVTASTHEACAPCLQVHWSLFSTAHPGNLPFQAAFWQLLG